MATTQAQFDAALAAFVTQFNAVGAALQTCANDINAKLAAAPPLPIDLTAEVQTIASLSAQLTSLTTQIAAEDPGPPANASTASAAPAATSAVSPEANTQGESGGTPPA